MSIGSDVCEGSHENIDDVCAIIDSDDTSVEDIIEVSNEATIEDTGANKDCSDSQDCSSTILLDHPINPTRPNDFSSYVGQRLSDHEWLNAITNHFKPTKCICFPSHTEYGKKRCLASFFQMAGLLSS